MGDEERKTCFELAIQNVVRKSGKTLRCRDTKACFSEFPHA